MASMTSVVTASIAAAAVGSALLTQQPTKDKALAAVKEHQTRVNEEEEAVLEKNRELQPKISPEFDDVNCFEY